MRSTRGDGDRVASLLIDVERDLDQKLSLDSLAARFGVSAYHFHRVFASAVGETPRRHVERLRIERAAYLLATSNASITEIGLAVGFENAETFSRRYKRATGLAPSAYRRMARAAQAERLETEDFFASAEYTLSRATFETLPETHMLASRRRGGYGALHESFGRGNDAWSELVEWARRAGIAIDDVLVGVFYDDPTMTPEAHQRADVCVALRGAVEVTGRVRCMRFGGGSYAVARYLGPVEHLLSAFRGLADDVRRSASYAFRDGPAVEFLREPDAGGAGVHRIDVAFPVAKRRRGSKKRQARRNGAR